MLINFSKEGYTTSFEGNDIIFTPIDIFAGLSVIRQSKEEYIHEKNKIMFKALAEE